MSATPNQTLTNSAEIRRGLGVLFTPGQVIELRAWGCHRFGEGIVSGFFNDHEKAAQAAEGLSVGGLRLPGESKALTPATGVFWTLNPVQPALLALANNRLRTPKTGEATADRHVTARRWLLVDCDPVRQGGVAKVSATDTEKAHAERVSKAIVRALREEFGFPSPVYSDSGNGYHALYATDLPNDETAGTLVKDFLKALAARFDELGVVNVDTSVDNSARVCKVPGTAVRKSDSLTDRPHRMSRILWTGDDPRPPVTPEQLEAVIAAWLPVEDSRTGQESARAKEHEGLEPFDMEAFIARNAIGCRAPVPYQGGQMWTLEACVFDPTHTGRDAALFLSASGAPGYKCFHNSCSGKDFQALMERFGDNYGDFVNPAYRYNKRDSSYIYSKEDLDKIAVNDAAREWDREPVPLDTDLLPPFPLEALPPVLRDFAAATARSVCTTEALPAVLALAGVAGAVQRRVEVRLQNGHAEPLILWCVSVAPPSERKSAIIARVRRPFDLYEARHNHEHQAAILASESEERVARGRLERAEREVARASTPETLAELDEARHAVQSLRTRHALKLTTGDTTAEALAYLLSENDERMAIFDAEGGSFDNLAGRYSPCPALAPFLKAWSGEALDIQRSGQDIKTGKRRGVTLTRPALTIGVGIQNDVLKELRKNKRLAGQGALQRCLFSFPGTPDALPTLHAPPVPGSVLAGYESCIERLLDLLPTVETDRDGTPLPHTLSLSPEAECLAEEVQQEFGAAARNEGTGLLAGWLGKAAGTCYRVAGILHMARLGPAGTTQPIAAATLSAARTVLRYFAEHSRSALQRIREGEEMEDARRILAWVKRNPPGACPAWEDPQQSVVSLRELRRNLPGIATEEEMLAALKALIAYGWAREREDTPTQGKRGRKPGARYQFHPSLTWSVEV